MSRFGQNVVSGFSALSLAACAFLALGSAPAASGQTAPYIIPYTQSTYAGAHGAYTSAASNCGSLQALDTSGDGCLALAMSVGTDPHDVRVDPLGNVYYVDGTSGTVIHKINPYTGVVTVYYGSNTSTKACTAQGSTDKTGDNCTSSDNAANSTTTYYTYNSKVMRGMGVGLNGDLTFAGYNEDEVHRITAYNQFTSLAAGIYTTAGANNSTAAASTFNAPRGAGFDANYNIYVADTGNNSIRLISNGTVTNYTAPNSSKTLSVTNGPVAASLVAAPEDVQVDPYGNVIIVDAGNNSVRAVYNGKGPFFGVPNPIVGWIYLIAGNGTSTGSYGATNTQPVVPATSITMSIRKFGINPQGDLYIADSGSNVVWFVDHVTGYLHLVAGLYGTTASNAPTSGICPQATSPQGDGCPGAFSSYYNNADLAGMPDANGNLYVGDAEGGVSANSRIRKLLSGLNFPSVSLGSSATQTIDLHFTLNDTPLGGDAAPAAGAFTIAGNNTDYAVKSSTCTAATDNTSDCLITVAFSPTVTGLDTAKLTVTSAGGGVGTFQLTGTGNMPEIAFDPGNTSTLAGATTSSAQGITLDGAGNAYIADTGNNRVLFYNGATNTSTVFAGGGSATCTGTTDLYGDGCLASAAVLKAPKAVAIDSFRNVYIADSGNNLIRKVTAGTGVITTYAGGLVACTTASDAYGDNCPGAGAIFSAPSGIAADTLGNLYVADTGHNIIRTISTSGYVAYFAGASTSCTNAQGATDSYGDGCPASAATFSGPTGLAFDNTGKNLVVADTGNNLVRKIYLGTTFGISGVGATSFPLPANIVVNPVTLIAGTGQPAATLDINNAANKSAVNAPTGVAVDAAGNTYIADTGNNSIRLVNTASGVISTIEGITGASGTGTLPGSATQTQNAAPAAVAVAPSGTLYISDAGNSRIIVDARNQVSYNFGRTNITASSPVVNFTELNISAQSAVIPSGLFTQNPVNPQFTLTAAANSNGSIPACATPSLASGAICNLQAQFTPTAATTQSSTFTQTNASVPTGNPAITLSGQGAILTPTTSVVTQSANSQFGAPVTFTATVTSSACNNAAPACYPTGTVTFNVDGTNQAPVALTTPSSTTALASTASLAISGLGVGSHTVTCSYSGDNYYAAGNCAAITAVVAKASTTSLLSATNNNAQQYPTTNCTASGANTICTQSTLTASIVSNTSGVPTGNVNFYAGSTLLGTASTNGNGVASLALTYTYDANGYMYVNSSGVTQDFTLAPGTYSLTCTYLGSSNFAGSSCSGVSFTVLPQPASLSLYAVGCGYASLQAPGSSTVLKSIPCGGLTYNGNAQVAVAQGATTDVTVFITPSNTLTGTLTFACSNLPQYSTCTFNPTSIALTPGTSFPTPVYVDVTLWNDYYNQTAKLVRPGGSMTSTRGGINYAGIIAWPLSVLSLAVMFFFRRRKSMRALTILGGLVLMITTSLTLSSCAGPGAYNPPLTPSTGAPGQPVTITVTGGGVSKSVTVYYDVTAPGIPGIN